MKQLKIELPFMGFYESIHDQLIDDAIESHFRYDHESGDDIELTEARADAIYMADTNWDAIRVEYAKKFTDLFADEFELDSLKYDDMTSPREYNFSTDRIFATIDADEFNGKIRVMVEHHPEWVEYIRERFTDRDGFWSNYSADSSDDDWIRDDLDECQYGTMIQFYIEHIYGDDSREWEFRLVEDMLVNEFDSIDEAIGTIEKYIETEGAKK